MGVLYIVFDPSKTPEDSCKIRLRKSDVVFRHLFVQCSTIVLRYLYGVYLHLRETSCLEEPMKPVV